MTWIDDRSRRSTPLPTIYETETAQQQAREPRTRGPRRGLAEQQALEITRDEIDLDVHRVTHRETAEVGLLQRVRHEIHLEARAVHRVHGETHPVHADRPLVRVVFRVWRGLGVRVLLRIADLGARRERGDAVDVAAHEVAAERRAGGEGLFEVHRIARVRRPQGGATQGLGRAACAEAVIGDRHRSETDTIDGDAVTEARAAHIELAGVNADAHIAAAALQRGDMTHGLDDAGEHELTRSLTALDARHGTPIVAHSAQLVAAQIDELDGRGPLRQPKEAARSVAQQFGREINHQFVHPSLFEQRTAEPRARLHPRLIDALCAE